MLLEYVLSFVKIYDWNWYYYVNCYVNCLISNIILFPESGFCPSSGHFMCAKHFTNTVLSAEDTVLVKWCAHLNVPVGATFVLKKKILNKVGPNEINNIIINSIPDKNTRILLTFISNIGQILNILKINYIYLFPAHRTYKFHFL